MKLSQNDHVCRYLDKVVTKHLIVETIKISEDSIEEYPTWHGQIFLKQNTIIKKEREKYLINSMSFEVRI